MSDDRMANLELRLAIAERDAEAMREHLRTMLDRQKPPSHTRRNGIFGLLGASFALFALTQPISTEAQGAAAQGLTVKAPFQVLDASGKVLMKVEAPGGQAQVTIGNPAAGGTQFGVGKSGAGFAIVRTATGSNGAIIGQWSGAPMGVRVFGPDGEAVEADLSLDSGNKGQLFLGDLDTGGTAFGVGKSGAGFMTLRRADGKDGIVVGQLDGRPMALRVFGDSAKEMVTLGTGQKGGSVKVMAASGTPVAAMLAGDTGGGLALTGPSGGKSAVSLSVGPSGGNVRVFPQAGGSAQAELTAAESGGGAVNVYNRAGENVVWMEATGKGEGQFVVGRAGKVFVEAAVLPSGVGFVVAGPKIGGPAAGLVPPNFIQGRTGGKN